MAKVNIKDYLGRPERKVGTGGKGSPHLEGPPRHYEYTPRFTRSTPADRSRTISPRQAGGMLRKADGGRS